MASKLVVEGITDEMTLVILARARKYSQYVKAVENALMGGCQFCQIDWDYNQLIMDNSLWYAWHCKPPEDYTKHHVLFVPKRHVTHSSDLTDLEIVKLWGKTGLRNAVKSFLGYNSCGTLMRDGDATLSAGTIQHLHIHDMVPDGTERVAPPFFKGAKSEQEGVERAIIYEKIRNNGGSLTGLTVGEILLVKDRI